MFFYVCDFLFFEKRNVLSKKNWNESDENKIILLLLIWVIIDYGAVSKINGSCALPGDFFRSIQGYKTITFNTMP